MRALKGPTPVVALVHVSPNGQPLDVQLVQSSAFPQLNNAVLTSAQQSTYNPATIDCMPTTGIYLFKAIFGT
ncbi:MAG: TonB family protein [Candidatus Eremiobacteraeota bacterium]|nr:TonB family protein [Candidatus Eremiobacteraeota bacterium]